MQGLGFQLEVLCVGGRSQKMQILQRKQWGSVLGAEFAGAADSLISEEENCLLLITYVFWEARLCVHFLVNKKSTLKYS